MKNNFIICCLLLIYIFLNTFVFAPLNLKLYNTVINPLIWICMCGVSYFLASGSDLRIKGKEDKTQSLIIILIIYIIVYFLLGLVFGFERTPYAKDIFSVLKNLWSFCGIIFFEEYVREMLVKNDKKSKFNYLFIVILYFLLELNVTNFFGHFASFKSTFTYVSSVLIPSILESAILTYLVYIGGAKFSILYRLVISIPPFVVPIIPDLDWFGLALVGISLPMVVYVYMNYIHVKAVERLSRKERKKYNPVVYVPVFGFIIVLAGFVIGLFKYQPIAIVSGSMSPTFDRGDAVVVRKLTDSEKDKLQIGDVIQFVSGTKYVIHRIHDITNDEYGNKQFITKGDHNNAPDITKANMKDIKAKISFIIPYIGYPSVWLSDTIS